MGGVHKVVMDVVNGKLILFRPFGGYIMTSVAVTGKFGKTTAANFKTQAMARLKNIGCDLQEEIFTCGRSEDGGANIP